MRLITTVATAGLSVLLLLNLAACGSSDTTSTTPDTKATTVDTNLKDADLQDVGVVDADGGIVNARKPPCNVQSDCTKMIGGAGHVCLFGHCDLEPDPCDIVACKKDTPAPFSCALDLSAVCDGCSRKFGCIRTAACSAFGVVCVPGTLPKDATSTADSGAGPDANAGGD